MVKRIQSLKINGEKYFVSVQITLQDLPEAPNAMPLSKENEEILDLPEVPSKAPVIQKAVEDGASQKKGLSQ